MTFPSSNFCPNVPSPKNNSYLSSSISCKKKTFDAEVISKRLSWELYLTPVVVNELFFTFTLIRLVSMPVFGKMNLKFESAAEFMNSEVKRVPSYM